MSKSRKSIFITVVIGLLAIAIGALVQQSQRSNSQLPRFSKIIILPQSRALTGVDFVDHHGQIFTAENLKGQWSILFFGFTNCPDICPTTMQTLKQIKAALKANDLDNFYQTLMITVDPQRDSQEQLANYVPFFDPSFIGLRSSKKTTTEFAKQLGILFVAQAAQENGAYDVDHSTALILLNSKGEMAGVISAPHKSDVIANDLIELAKHFGQQKIPALTIIENDKTTLQNDDIPLTKKSNNLQVNEAWIRPAPTSAKSLAAYLTITNSSDIDVVITDASSDQFNGVMIHETVVNDDGTASMNHLNSLTIPARGSVKLSPMGIHIMLMNPASPLQLGDKVQINLVGEGGQLLTQEIEVRPEPKQD